MIENTLSERLTNIVKEIAEEEIREVHLIIAIIKKRILDLINKNIKLLEEEFDINCERFGKKCIKFVAEKGRIIEEYKIEFNRIASKFEEEYMNLGLEIQEIQSNEKIAISNMKKIILEKEKFIKSGEYEKFLIKIKGLEEQRDNCLVKAEFDKITSYLDNVKDPIEIYNKKIDAFAEKYIRYCGLEEACIIKLTECIDNIEESINSVMQYDIGKLMKVNKKSVFSKLFSKIGGTRKFEKNYLAKKKENIIKIKSNNNSLLEKIDNEINDILSVLIACNSKINQVFIQTIEGV